jgi:hypothetical protein
VKHLDPANRISQGCEDLQRYNVLLVLTEDEKSGREVDRLVTRAIASVLAEPIVVQPSDAVRLNPVERFGRYRLNYMRVVVFTGEYRKAL